MTDRPHMPPVMHKVRVFVCLRCGRPIGDVHAAGGRTYLIRAFDRVEAMDGELVTCPICGAVRRFVSCREKQ